MRSINNRKQIVKSNLNYYCIVASVFGILNIISLQNKTCANLLISFECFAVLFYLVKGDLCGSFSMLLMITAISIGNATFAGSNLFYSFNSFRLLGIDLIAWSLSFFVIFGLFFYKCKKKPLKKIHFSMFFCLFTGLVVIAVIMGLLCVLFDDNGITHIPNYMKYYIAIFYIMAFIPLTIIISVFVCYKKNQEHFYKIKNAIFAIFFANALQAFFSVLTHASVNYSGIEGLGVSLSPVYFYMPLIICAFFYQKKEKISIIYLAIVVLGLILIILNNANGKVLLLLLMVPIVVFKVSNSKSKIILIICLLLCGFGLFGYFAFSNHSFDNYLLEHKINEVIGLLDVFSDDWLQIMPMSPRYRILEFVNILREYVNKPWFLITGKGYLGSITDHINGFVRVGGDFSDIQWDNGIFFFLHESLNLLFLNNGLIGLCFWFGIFILTIKKFKKSFFILLGGVWFCLTYGYSVPITIVGLSSLCIGLLDLDDEHVITNQLKQISR